jgi:hypothetical protein
MPGSAEGLAAVALALFDRVELGADQLFRLVGVGLSNLQNAEEPPLFCRYSQVGLKPPMGQGLKIGRPLEPIHMKHT